MWRQLDDEIARTRDLAAQDPAFGVFEALTVMQSIDKCIQMRMINYGQDEKEFGPKMKKKGKKRSKKRI